MAHPPVILIDPETWKLLAPEAFDADRSERRPIRRAGLGLAAAVALIALGIWSGLWTPSLTATGEAGGAHEAGSSSAWVEYQVRNERAMAVTIDGAGTIDVPGVEIIRASTIGAVPGLDTGSLHVDFRVVDCAAVGEDDHTFTAERVTVTARTWRGDVPVTIGNVGDMLSSMASEMCSR